MRTLDSCYTDEEEIPIIVVVVVVVMHLGKQCKQQYKRPKAPRCCSSGAVPRDLKGTGRRPHV